VPPLTLVILQPLRPIPDQRADVQRSIKVGREQKLFEYEALIDHHWLDFHCRSSFLREAASAPPAAIHASTSRLRNRPAFRAILTDGGLSIVWGLSDRVPAHARISGRQYVGYRTNEENEQPGFCGSEKATPEGCSMRPVVRIPPIADVRSSSADVLNVARMPCMVTS
jgi:hypothetical protein